MLIVLYILMITILICALKYENNDVSIGSGGLVKEKIENELRVSLIGEKA